MSATTRDLIVDEAMRLFSEHGYAGTSVAKIEAAAGLTPGAGGLYHHFTSKEAVLAAGVERHLARLDALRDIRNALTPVGDLKAELTITARYILAELDSEAELLRILASETRRRTELLNSAVEVLVRSTFERFAAWVCERAEGALTAEQAAGIAAVGLGSLIGTHMLRDVLGAPIPVEDNALVETWTSVMFAAIAGPTATS
jgi:AcrR family transcriptional regulator